jgi:hypothetical protein
MEGKDNTMPLVMKSNETGTLPNGWLGKAGQGYYTGNLRRVLECWMVFPQFAKVDQRKCWRHASAGKSSPQPQSTNVDEPALWGWDKPIAWLPLEVKIAQQEQDEQNDQQ